MSNKTTTVTRFVLQTLHRNITHLAVIVRKTNLKLDILKGGGWEMEKGRQIMYKLCISRKYIIRYIELENL